ncbi:hypothetical protein [Staphylothermus hellenicus]|uniref:Uncharacterized protein n=1 Tax=Staphylothermus hellenicus (strain DSM 12710 / JCM 10830 / BK20S6-10-b1 / P8) TaxID=591019 RepID=D7DBC4_STAHD|nr:hypothetical protein [Staphylothermus hellenicus]ADI31471.1 hypothetical protein Shell_0339 [Staphylothermus hellenicus DSM 12710]
MKTDHSYRSTDLLNKIIGIMRILIQYNYGKDYEIHRSSREAIVQIHNSKLLEQLGHRNITRNNRIIFEYPLIIRHQLCILPRLIDLESIEKEKEIIGSAILYKLFPRNHGSNYIIIIDDLSRSYILTSYYLSLYIEKYNNRKVDPIIFYKYLREILKLRKIMDEAKNLERSLKIRFDPELHEKYIVTINQLDNITPIIARLWEENKELFDRVNSIVEEEKLFEEEIMEKTNRLVKKEIELIDNYLVEKINEIVSSIIDDGYVALKFSDIIRSAKKQSLNIDEKLSIIQRYLEKNYGCRDILLVDGEEYYVLIKVSKIPIIPINIF